MMKVFVPGCFAFRAGRWLYIWTEVVLTEAGAQGSERTAVALRTYVIINLTCMNSFTREHQHFLTVSRLSRAILSPENRQLLANGLN